MAVKAICFLACFLLLFVSIRGAMLDCNELSLEDCAYAVSASGARCVLEKHYTVDKTPQFVCQTSDVAAERKEAWIETDECVSVCGLERMAVGMSTDGMIHKAFLNKWCSPECQGNCPNIVDLYHKLASGEDIYLPHVCEYLRPSARRLIGTTSFTKGTKEAIGSLESAQAPLAAELSADEIAPLAA